jgi:hypothetical protein
MVEDGGNQGFRKDEAGLLKMRHLRPIHIMMIQPGHGDEGGLQGWCGSYARAIHSEAAGRGW